MKSLIFSLLAVSLLGASVTACSLIPANRQGVLSPVWSSPGVSAGLFGLYVQASLDSDRLYIFRQESDRSGRFRAYRRADGQNAWVQPVTEPCDPPVVAHGRVFCPADDLFAFDATTGQTLWRASIGRTMQLIEGAADASRVYAGTSDFNGQTTEAFAADAATGQILWRRGFTGEGWEGARLRSLTLSPEGDLIAAVVALLPPARLVNTAAVFVALDPASGAERWRVQIGQSGSYRDTGGLTFFEHLMLYNDGVGGEAVAIDRRTREIAWRARWTPTYLGTLRAPQVADGVAYFADAAGVTFAVDARTGRELWRTDLDGGAYSLEVCGPVVLMNNGPVEVLDRRTGRHRGRLLRSDDRAGPMAVADGVLYVSAQSGVYAFDCHS